MAKKNSKTQTQIVETPVFHRQQAPALLNEIRTATLSYQERSGQPVAFWRGFIPAVTGDEIFVEFVTNGIDQTFLIGPMWQQGEIVVTDSWTAAVRSLANLLDLSM